MCIYMSLPLYCFSVYRRRFKVGANEREVVLLMGDGECVLCMCMCVCLFFQERKCFV